MAAAVASGLEYAAGVSSPEIKEPTASDGFTRSENNDFRQLVLACNKDGMDYLRKAQYKQSFEQLKYAEAVLVAKEGEDEPTNLLAVTCNNLGCYYKKVGKMHAALSYLRKALKIEVSLQTDDVTVAGTHLNICAILSKLDKHDKAVQHALCALDLINNRVNVATDVVSQDEYSVLAIAYHNVAVERDFLHQWDQAAAAYQQGHQVSKKFLGEQHPLTQTLGKNCGVAMQKAQKFSRDNRIATGPPPAMPSSQPRPAQLPKHNSSELGTSAAGASSGAGPGLLPGISGASTRGKDNQSPQEEPLPISGGRQIHQEAEEWLQNEDLHSAWRQHAAAPAPIGVATTAIPTNMAPAQLQQGAAIAQPYSMSPRGVNSQAISGGVPFAPAEHGIPLLSETAAGIAMEPMDHWSPQQPQQTFLHSIAQNVRAIQAGAPDNPPPLVMIDREKTQQQLYRTPGEAGGLGSSSRLVFDDALEPTPPSQPRPQGRRRPSNTRLAAEGSPLSNALGRQAGDVAFAGSYEPAKRTRAERDAARAAAKASKMANSEVQEPTLRAPQSLASRKAAAQTIQRAWQKWWKGTQRNKNRIERERIAATMIQARWRAFHVRRSKLNKHCIIIQKWTRGYLVRAAMKRHKAAVCVQRHAQGMLARKEKRKQEESALKIQRQARGKMARKFANAHKDDVKDASATLQRGARMWQAKKIANEKRAIRDGNLAQAAAAQSIQSVFRGGKAREQVAAVKRERDLEKAKVTAAIKLQSMVRRSQAKKRVDAVRQEKVMNMHRAATVIRKHWLRWLYRTRFLELKIEYQTHESSIITMQRYVRGYLVRLRMWRDAIRSEEELWAAVEIQRCWRGYLGRLRWELAYEALWSREVAAQRIQRYVRGWLARSRAHRIRKRLARAEFQKARKRFKAAQKVQALVRGHQVRKNIMGYRRKKLDAATRIQKVFRGHQLRCALWEQVIARRIVQIQAVGRGFLVRCRKFKLLAKVIMIQRAYRHWLHFIPEAERQRRLKKWRLQRLAAKA